MPTQPAQPPTTEFVLKVGEPVGAGLLRILIEQVDLASFHVQRLSESDVHVHEVRKASKRLRAVLRMVPDTIGQEAYCRMNVAVRDVARTLSAVRSSVVQVQVFDGIIDGRPALGSATGVLRRELDDDRQRARAVVDAALVGGLTSQLEEVREDIAVSGLARGGTITVRGIQRTYQRGRTGMNRAYATGTTESFHMWRKQVKYLRHQMEVIAAVGPVEVATLIEDLETLGEALGRDNDLADLTHWVARSNAAALVPTGYAELLDVLAQQRSDLETGLRPLAGRVYGRSPSAFVSDLLPSWS